MNASEPAMRQGFFWPFVPRRAAAASAAVATFLNENYSAGRWLDPKTRQQMAISVRLLDRWAAATGRPTPVRLADLARPLVLAWMDWLAAGRSAKTVNNKRADLMTLWREANRQGLAQPVDQIRRMPVPRREPVVWRLDQIEQIFAAVERLTGRWDGVPVALAWRIFLLLFWDTGGRLEEIRLAELPQLDRAGGRLYVPAEHRKGRRADQLYTLHPQTIAAIAASLPSDRRRIFPFPYQRPTLWRHLKRILSSVGLPADRYHLFHCFRRSAESYAAAARGAQWAADAVGHSVEVARRHYISREIAPGPRLIDALPRPRIDSDPPPTPVGPPAADPSPPEPPPGPRLRLWAG